MTHATDRKHLFRFPCPTGRHAVAILGCYDHVTHNLDLSPDPADDSRGGTDAWNDAEAFCQAHQGYYFYWPDVLLVLRRNGVDSTQIQED